MREVSARWLSCVHFLAAENSTIFHPMTGNHEDPGTQAAALHRLSNTFDAVRRAFSEFLRIPTGIILVFLLLAVCSYLLDKTRVLPGWNRRDNY
jgi:ribose/xylose/arabinose/galactoside ABC-type transport system permease subunit